LDEIISLIFVVKEGSLKFIGTSSINCFSTNWNGHGMQFLANGSGGEFDFFRYSEVNIRID